MQKVQAAVLVIILAFSASIRNAAASIRGSETQPANLTFPAEGLQTNTALTMKSGGDQKLENDAVHLRMNLAPKKFSAALEAETKDLVGDADGQSTPTSTQNPPVHHNHHLRNLVILGVALAIGFACLAAAAK